MELTPEVKAALDAIPGLTKSVEELKPLAAKVPELEKTLALKDAEITELKKSASSISNSTALQALKSAYPDVPEASLNLALELPADKRENMLKPMQAKATELKALAAKTDPTSGWADAGSIEPSSEQERAAKQAEKRKNYEEHAKQGNLMGMLGVRSAEFAAHVRKALSPSA